MTVETTAHRSERPIGREWPAWQVPASALVEWVALVEAIAGLEVEPACADEPERWWSKLPTDLEWAQQVCARCPVLGPCRSYAAAAGERDGVWGGLTSAERRRSGGTA